MKWDRELPMSTFGKESRENWIRTENNKKIKYEVDVKLGKKTDLLKLKSNIVSSLKEKQKYYKESREKIYLESNTQPVTKCPVCEHSSENSEKKINIYGANYSSCNNCTHIYVNYRPTKSAIDGFYLNDVTYAATYTDKKSAEARLNAIAIPWVKWTVACYQKAHNRKPLKILDVGSGAGHFVAACRRSGIHCDGIELSESSRMFSKEIWDIELDGRDFNKAAKDYLGYDIVTFWGLLEHTPNPSTILKSAYKIVSKSGFGMVISKVPRWDSLSAAIQRVKSDTVIRHLDPMGHIMCFTDASTAEIYHKNNLAPTSAWYYGMDVYETLMQVGNKIDQYDVLTQTGSIQTDLQQFIDESRFSDGLTLAGIPF
tara:strand:- start:381 stop:1493 length:1113 start_codon:yes stop_codon:yes gene_type:complete